MKKYDLAVLGGGPGGYNAAAIAAKAGLKTVLFEKNKVGGVCLNEGCIPTKALLYSANMLDSIKEAKKYGINIEGEITADYKKVVSRKSKIVRKLVAGVAQKLKSAGVETVEATATLVGENGDGVLIRANDESYVADKVILATGSEAFVPPISGLSEVEYWTSREALDTKELPESILIVGGGVIGMEFVSVFNSFGVPVTVVEMMPKILGPMDGEISSHLQAEYEKRGVKFYLNTKVVAASAKGLTVELPDGTQQELEGERILVSAGRRAVLKDLGLDALNVKVERNIIVDEYLRTSNPRIYAIGDVNGHSMLAHTAIREGEVAVKHILSGEGDPMRYDVIPGVVYTHPEIAGVGATEEELQKKGVEYKVLGLPASFAGRFVVENEGGNGLFKLLVDAHDGRILGGHMIGNPSSEFIVTIGMAMTENLTVEGLKRHVFPHPTVSEIVHEVLFE
nr:dihydrolipoyl dehydrogenase [uncultured Porphyromonas sp.]